MVAAYLIISPRQVLLGCEISPFPLKVERSVEESLKSPAKKGKASLASCLLDMEIQLSESGG